MIFLTYVYHDARFGECTEWSLIFVPSYKTSELTHTSLDKVSNETISNFF